MPVLTLKYRLYPTLAQETLLRETLDVCRQVYNSLVHWCLAKALAYLSRAYDLDPNDEIKQWLYACKE